MAPPPTTPPAAPTGKPGALVAKLGGQKNAAILGAGATVVLVAILAMRKSSSTAATDTTSPSETVYDSTPYDQWTQWQQQYEGLQDRVDTLENGTAANGGVTPTTPPTSTLPAPIIRPVPSPPSPKPPPPKAKPKPPPKPRPKPPTKKRALPILPRRKK